MFRCRTVSSVVSVYTTYKHLRRPLTRTSQRCPQITPSERPIPSRGDNGSASKSSISKMSVGRRRRLSKNLSVIGRLRTARRGENKSEPSQNLLKAWSDTGQRKMSNFALDRQKKIVSTNCQHDIGTKLALSAY